MKIAILLSGRLTSYDKHYQNIMDNLVQDNEVDFYAALSEEPINKTLIDGFLKLYNPVAWKYSDKPLLDIEWDKVKSGKNLAPIKKNVMYMWRNRQELKGLLTGDYDWVISTRLDIFYKNSLEYSHLEEDKINIPYGSDYDERRTIEPETLMKYHLKNKSIDVKRCLLDHKIFPKIKMKNKINIHLVLYSNGEPYTSTKQKLIDTIKGKTKYNVIIHSDDLDSIKQKEWFKHIRDLPEIKKAGRRDGYYCNWKPFVVKDAYDLMGQNDILYYVDSSQHYLTGFEEDIDKLIDITIKNDIIAGSVGLNINNNYKRCCHKLDVWDRIIPNNDNSIYLDKPHQLSSWFVLTKKDTITNFLNEWIKWTIYKDEKSIYPLAVLHHTCEQAIMNILVYKYNFKVFCNPKITHNRNKDRNKVLKTINNEDKIDKYFINLI